MSETSIRLPKFRDRAELLAFLLEVAEATTVTLDLDTLMSKVASIVQEVAPWDLFAILLYSEKMEGLNVRHAVGHRAEVVKSLVIPLGEGITGAAATSREPVLVSDVRSDPRYVPTVDAVRTELAVPMIARDRLVGVIDLQSTRTNAYSEEHSALVRLVASRVATSIDNARLYRRTLRHNHTLRTLASLSQSFSATLDLHALLNIIATTVRKLINYDAFSILLLDQDRKRLTRRFSLRYDERVDLDHINLGHGVTGAAVERRESVLVRDTRDDERYIESTQGIRSEVAVPLIVPERVLGVMDLESSRVGYFNQEHVRTLELLAPLIANSVENARLYEELGERERSLADNLKAARDLQNVLLLREAPPIEGLEVATRSRPAREVSGDLYEFFKQPDGLDIITLGDVSGKGAAAALYATLVSGLMRTLVRRRPSPGVLMQSLNAALGERKVPAVYVTLLVLYWQQETKLFTMSNAGMFPPIVCRAGNILKQQVLGIPLGLLDNRVYDEVKFHAEPGDVVLLYSDGIYDQATPAGEEEYGRRPLYALLEAHWEKSAEEIADEIFSDVDRFKAGGPLSDDQTVLVIKVQ